MWAIPLNRLASALFPSQNVERDSPSSETAADGHAGGELPTPSRENPKIDASEQLLQFPEKISCPSCAAIISLSPFTSDRNLSHASKSSPSSDKNLSATSLDLDIAAMGNRLSLTSIRDHVPIQKPACSSLSASTKSTDEAEPVPSASGLSDLDQPSSAFNAPSTSVHEHLRVDTPSHDAFIDFESASTVDVPYAPVSTAAPDPATPLGLTTADLNAGDSAKSLSAVPVEVATNDLTDLQSTLSLDAMTLGSSEHLPATSAELVDSDNGNSNKAMSIEQFRAYVAAHQPSFSVAKASGLKRKPSESSLLSPKIEPPPSNLSAAANGENQNRNFLPTHRPEPAQSSLLRPLATDSNASTAGTQHENSSLETPEHVSLLLHLCHTRGLTPPSYHFTESPNQVFHLQVYISLSKEILPHVRQAIRDLAQVEEWQTTKMVCSADGTLVVEQREFTSKKLAKKSVSQAACALLNLGFANAPRSLSNNDRSLFLETGVGRVQNPNNLLHEFQADLRCRPPRYNEFDEGDKFGCTVTLYLTMPLTIPLILPPTSDGAHQSQVLTFGSEKCDFLNKKAAKRAATEKAIQFLQDNGLLSVSTAFALQKSNPNGIPLGNRDVRASNEHRNLSFVKPEGSNSLPSGPDRNNPPSDLFQLNPIRQEEVTDGSMAIRGRAAKENVSFRNIARGQPTATPSYSHQAAVLRTKLGLGNLQYDIKSVPGKSSFYNGAAYLEDCTIPHLAGPLGQVELIYGKKGVKEAILKGVVEVLEDELDSRTLGVGYPSSPATQLKH